MEPISLLFTAIVAGATAALKTSAKQAVVDAYGALKDLVKKKWQRVDLEMLERDPVDGARQQVFKKELTGVLDLADREVLERAQAVLAAVRAHDAQAAAAAGITLEDIEAGASVNIDNVLAEGLIVARRIKAAQDFNFRGVQSRDPTKR